MKNRGVCTWREEEDSWDTSCNEKFVIIDGTPEDNGMRFCTYCGRRLQQELASPMVSE